MVYACLQYVFENISWCTASNWPANKIVFNWFLTNLPKLRTLVLLNCKQKTLFYRVVNSCMYLEAVIGFFISLPYFNNAYGNDYSAVCNKEICISGLILTTKHLLSYQIIKYLTKYVNLHALVPVKRTHSTNCYYSIIWLHI